MGARSFYVYILASRIGGTLYIGVTHDLIRRVAEHRLKLMKGFTKKYEVDRLIYFEQFDDAENAIRREKRLKNWNRAWKIRLIEELNPAGTICIRALPPPNSLSYPANAGYPVIWKISAKAQTLRNTASSAFADDDGESRIARSSRAMTVFFRPNLLTELHDST